MRSFSKATATSFVVAAYCIHWRRWHVAPPPAAAHNTGTKTSDHFCWRTAAGTSASAATAPMRSASRWKRLAAAMTSPGGPARRTWGGLSGWRRLVRPSEGRDSQSSQGHHLRPHRLLPSCHYWRLPLDSSERASSALVPTPARGRRRQRDASEPRRWQARTGRAPSGVLCAALDGDVPRVRARYAEDLTGRLPHVTSLYRPGSPRW